MHFIWSQVHIDRFILPGVSSCHILEGICNPQNIKTLCSEDRDSDSFVACKY